MLHKGTEAKQLESQITYENKQKRKDLAGKLMSEMITYVKVKLMLFHHNLSL